MRNFFVLLFVVFTIFGFGQNTKLERGIKKFQKHLNKEYKSRSDSPLRGDHFNNFEEHPFFPINLKYHVLADFEKLYNTAPFELPTSSGKSKIYREFGKVTFEIDGEKYSLILYQSMSLINNPQYKNHLFLPFRDKTNGKSTYGGGRYLDLKIPKGDKIELDFNKAYQPYCAYNAYDYSCPIVPEINTLPVEIKAGVQYEDIWFEH